MTSAESLGDSWLLPVNKQLDPDFITHFSWFHCRLPSPTTTRVELLIFQRVYCWMIWMSIGKKTAIPPSQTLSDFCWNERPFPHLRTDPIPIGSIWLYMFMYDICMIYIYILYTYCWFMGTSHQKLFGSWLWCGLRIVNGRTDFNELNLLGH